MRVPKLCRNGDGRAFAIWPKSRGKRQYFGSYGSPQATQAYADWLSRVATGLAPQPLSSDRETLIATLATDYLQFARTQGYTSHHLNHIRRSVEAFSNQFGTCTGTEIGAQMVRAYRENLVANGNLSRLSLHNKLSAVKTFVRWCCENGLIPEETWARILAVKRIDRSDRRVRPEKSIRPVDLTTIKSTLPHLPKRAADMLKVQFYCGMRPQDVRNLRWADIDRACPVWIFRPTQHKNQRRGKTLAKAVPLPAQQILLQYPCAPEDWIFRSRTGKRIGPSELKRCIDSAIARAAENGVVIEHWTPNQLRHTIGTEVRARYGTSAAQDYLGHSDPNTTMIYAEQSLDVLRKVGQSIDEHLL